MILYVTTWPLSKPRMDPVWYFDLNIRGSPLDMEVGHKMYSQHSIDGHLPAQKSKDSLVWLHSRHTEPIRIQFENNTYRWSECLVEIPGASCLIWLNLTPKYPQQRMMRYIYTSIALKKKTCENMSLQHAWRQDHLEKPETIWILRGTTSVFIFLGTNISIPISYMEEENHRVPATFNKGDIS